MNKQQVEVTKEELIEFFEKIKIDNDKEKKGQLLEGHPVYERNTI